MVEDQFYEIFDKHIKEYTTKIQAKIAKYAKERAYVHDKIEKIAQDILDCQRIKVK